mmetsp:Transcript_1666/g.3913  ORF Transcript_1666/g.3913 Transcript_1666/m.3913 type:complete len:80 (-) Transcript_1666:794-1033(-)
MPAFARKMRPTALDSRDDGSSTSDGGILALPACLPACLRESAKLLQIRSLNSQHRPSKCATSKSNESINQSISQPPDSR